MERPLIIFDIDGTLFEINSGVSAKPTMVEAIKDVYNVDVNQVELDHNGMCDSKIITELLRRYGLQEEHILSNLELDQYKQLFE